MPATIAQIAKEAGVSIGTVSRILNGKNKENRPAVARRSERVRRLARKYGYRPNQAARTVRSGRFGAVAFLSCSDPGADVFEIPLLHGIQSELAAINSRLMMCEMPQEGFEQPEAIPQVLNEYSVDGLLIDYDFDLTDAVMDLIDSSHVPYVWLNAKRDRNCVYPDDFEGARKATQHLIRLGHRKLAFVSYHDREQWTHYSVHDRHAGFNAALAEAGLEPVTTHLRGGFVYGEALAHARELLQSDDRPTAVVCYEKHEAVAVWMAAIGLGLRLPEDLSMIAFNSDLIRNQTGLPVTTMRVPFAQVGKVAVQLLHEAIESEGDDQPAQVVSYSIEEEEASCRPPLTKSASTQSKRA